MPMSATLTTRDAKALAERVLRRGDAPTLAAQVAVLETEGRTAGRLILALLRHVNRSDVFQLPPEA
jgi:hypothetical protein